MYKAVSLFSSSQLVKVFHVISKFWQYKSSITDKLKATDNAIIQFNKGRHSLLVQQSISTAARYAAANKKLNQKTTRWPSAKTRRVFCLA